MLDYLTYGARFYGSRPATPNLVFQKENLDGEKSCLVVYSRDENKMEADAEHYTANILSTDEVKELKEYLELYLKTES